MADTRLKIAVFIDFDNIEIGVKSTLGVQFDVGVVLEALKERGDVVSKIAYGDWTRAGDYSRSLTQHATKLVQRNLTPGGDKNGADINLALDALEMAFTHGHINAYVIVGGDSDFITLVEKLKQYDKQIFVVGGRAFTSLVMQRNCHEFIAYENLVGSRRSQDRGRQTGPVAAAQTTSLEQAVPLVRRALKVLADREVSPQLGPAEEHARSSSIPRSPNARTAPAVSVISRRSWPLPATWCFAKRAGTCSWSSPKACLRERRMRHALPRRAPECVRHPSANPARLKRRLSPPAATAAAAEPRVADGIREVRRLFQSAQNPPRWPMYIRQAKQFLRNVDASFDERKFGFASLRRPDARLPARGSVSHRARSPGCHADLPRQRHAGGARAGDRRARGDGRERASRIQRRGRSRNPSLSARRQREPWLAEPLNAGEQEVVDGDVLQEMEAPQPVVDGEAEPLEARTPPRRRRPRAAPRAQGARKTADTAAPPRSRKTPAKARSPRTRSRKETPSE